MQALVRGGPVHVVTALPAEARPLIRHFALVEHRDCAPFRVFGGETVSLVIAGVGRVAAAAACGYLHGVAGNLSHAAWLNVGIAGHRELPAGTARLAHRISSKASGQVWYPMRVFEAPCPGASVCTVDAPEREFTEDALYDMEAAGVFATAVRFASAELVHAVKVVSDNREHSFEGVDAGRASELIESAIGIVERTITALSTLAATQGAVHAHPPDYVEMERHWHFTATQRVELRALLGRWRHVLPGKSALASVRAASPGDGSPRDGRAAIRHLRAELARAPSPLKTP